jgi:hypothetical protein
MSVGIQWEVGCFQSYTIRCSWCMKVIFILLSCVILTFDVLSALIAHFSNIVVHFKSCTCNINASVTFEFCFHISTIQYWKTVSLFIKFSLDGVWSNSPQNFLPFFYMVAVPGFAFDFSCCLLRWQSSKKCLLYLRQGLVNVMLVCMCNCNVIFINWIATWCYLPFLCRRAVEQA